MEHSPDGKAYLVGHGAADPDPTPRDANASWITGDQVYLARVEPNPAKIDDLRSWEFFAGNDAQGRAKWSNDFRSIRPLIDWNNHCGNVSITYNAPLRKYLMAVTDGGNTISGVRHLPPRSGPNRRPLPAGGLHEALRGAGVLREFSIEVHQPGRPDPVDVLRGQLYEWKPELAETRANPPGSGYGMVLQQVKLAGGTER